MIIKGMEQIQAWTMRKEFESNLEVSDSRKDENMDKYKCHKYLKLKQLDTVTFVAQIQFGQDISNAVPD